MNSIQERLERSAGVKLKVRINDNRTHMLSIRWEASGVRLSLHRIFLEAPQNVMEELACYIRGRKRKLSPSIRRFIEQEMRKVNYSERIRRENLVTRGKFLDLQEIYDEVNRDYFQDELSLTITWYGDGVKRGRRSCNFGLYSDPEKLIKIHRLLDQEAVPKYVVSYIVYHEMLHAVCPPVVGEKSTRFHPPEFKRKEREFREFQRATLWIKQNKWRFF